MSANLYKLALDFDHAVYVMEMRWAQLKGARDRYDARLMARYIRSLNRCDRLRKRLRHLMDAGKL